MSQDAISNNRRIAKNTLLLYLRTIIILLINLYLSRVILEVLGIEDYGIYNAVGGAVAMFSLISGALSTSISRYLTFELGKGNKERLQLVFSTSINILLVISILILALAEPLGIWFLNTQMNIPELRLQSANWVFQSALIVFLINVISVPYNAAIIAHEHMSAFAYISILEACFRFGVVLLLKYCFMAADTLILYSVLLVGVALIIRIIYGLYCNKNFDECHYNFIFSKKLTKEMTSFAGWSFLTSTAYIFNTQGVNILINLFFGVTLNAARGIATQVDGAVMQFVNNFTMAINPQITKNYAQGDFVNMYKLVCLGAKYSFFLMLFFAIPLILEIDQILFLWLGKNVPEHTAAFVSLGILGAIIDRIGITMTTACMATGKIRNYTIWVSCAGSLAFFLSWLFFLLGYAPESAYIAFIISYIVVNIVRLIMVKLMIQVSIITFVREVVIKGCMTLVVAIILPLFFINYVEASFIRLILTIVICTISITTSIFFLGLNVNERKAIKGLVINRIRR